ncbi:MAG: nicotinate phosphoribosyltransferase [Candidatus Omnitrophica bacterium]|nr:nicotinate phosphoribosyltransferase [Candidatus Omnitrophota bacterium]
MPSQLSLLVDFYELAMAQSYFNYKFNTHATFDLFVRKLPANRSYLLFCGLEDVINYLEKLKFSKDDLSYLSSLKVFSKDFLRFLEKFRFRGDVYALREGEIFFANEPMLRVTASIIEAQIVESCLLNTVNLQTMISSKSCRIVNVAGDRGVYDFSLRRTHGKDAAVKVARSCYIAGFKGTSNVLAAKTYKILAVGTMAHSFVMSFDSEIDSFRAFANTFPKRTILLVDTYNSIKGISNAVIIAKELKKKGFALKGIRLDSGDLISLSKVARRMLNNAGLHSVRIFASGNLDEYKINNITKARAPIDDFGVGTNMGTSCDAPFLDVIYKISEVSDSTGRFLPTMKLSQRKVTYPGRKQIYRFQERGSYKKDIIALEGEMIRNGQPLLRQVIKKGKVIYRFPSLSEIKDCARKNLFKLPQQYKSLDKKSKYPVQISPSLKKAIGRLSLALKKKSGNA